MRALQHDLDELAIGAHDLRRHAFVVRFIPDYRIEVDTRKLVNDKMLDRVLFVEAHH